jgi:hypothetical protein
VSTQQRESAVEDTAVRRPAWQKSYHDVLETIFVSMVLVALYGLAPRLYGTVMLNARAASVEALALAATQELCVQESWAVTGRLPAPASCIDATPDARPPGRFVSAISAPDPTPSFQYQFGTRMPALAHQHLDVWLAEGPGEFPATWAWRCGPALPAPGMHAVGTDHTSIPAGELPASCRALGDHVASR